MSPILWRDDQQQVRPSLWRELSTLAGWLILLGGAVLILGGFTIW